MLAGGKDKANIGSPEIKYSLSAKHNGTDMPNFHQFV
jgi:hypothetical protein